MDKRKSPEVTVIILNYNGLKFTRDCLKSVLKTNYPNLKIILVDNGSINNEALVLKKEFKDKRVSFIRFENNLGFVGGNNEASKTVRSKYVVFLNNDTTVDPNWLQPLVGEMESDKKVAACQPKIKLISNPKKFDYAGACGGFIDKYGYPFTRGRIFFTSEVDKGQYDKKTEIFWASGVAMMIKRELFLKVGMFDKRFFLYMEEIDLCWKLIKNGYKILSVPSSIVYHHVAASSRKNMLKKRFFEHRNNLILLVNNYPLHDLLAIFPQRLVFEFITFIFYALKGDFNSFFGLLMAHINFWWIFPSLLASREWKNGSNSKSFKGLIYPGSLVIDYFILGRRRFDQI